VEVSRKYMKAWVNGTECRFFYDEVIPQEQAPEAFYYRYYLRHDENNWVKPVSVEPYVFVNFFGTIFMKDKLEFDKYKYIEIKHFKFEGNYIQFRISESLLNRMFRL
jgi:hypothetical protein